MCISLKTPLVTLFSIIFVYCRLIEMSFYAVLASWFRLKYPHLAIGALASSAPVLYIDDVIQPNAYMGIVSADFKVTYQYIYF